MTTTTTVGPVCIDDYLTVLAQYDPTLRWNGWLASPALDAWTVQRVLDVLGDDDQQRFEWVDGGALRVTTDCGDGTTYTELLHPDADGLYALGAYGWVWAEDTQPWDTSNDLRPDVERCADCDAPIVYDEQAGTYWHEDPHSAGCFLIGERR